MASARLVLLVTFILELLTAVASARMVLLVTFFFRAAHGSGQCKAGFVLVTIFLEMLTAVPSAKLVLLVTIFLEMLTAVPSAKLVLLVTIFLELLTAVPSAKLVLLVTVFLRAAHGSAQCKAGCTGRRIGTSQISVERKHQCRRYDRGVAQQQFDWKKRVVWTRCRGCSITNENIFLDHHA